MGEKYSFLNTQRQDTRNAVPDTGSQKMETVNIISESLVRPHYVFHLHFIQIWWFSYVFSILRLTEGSW